MSELPRSPDEEHISTADRILDVATEFFARKGYHGTRVRDIAREVNLSISTLYYYARNKGDLFGQLTFRPQVHDPLQPGQVEEFRAFIHTYVDRMLRFSDQR